MRKPLTARQQGIYDFIVKEIRLRGMPPTIREIGDRFGMRSSNGAREPLNALARKGYIRRHDRLSRGIELVEPVEASARISTGRQIPLITHLPATTPEIQHATITGYLVVDSSLLPPNGTPFAVVVSDNSLRSIGLHTGDFAIAVTTPPAKDGDLAVVLVGSQLAVRRCRLVNSVVLPEADRGREHMASSANGQPESHLVGQVWCLVRSLGTR